MDPFGQGCRAYTFHIGQSQLVPQLNWRYVGSQPSSSCVPIGSCTIPAYGILGGTLYYYPSLASPWSIGLWGTNILDRRYALDVTLTNPSDGILSILPGRPLEYGAELQYRF